MAFSFLISGKGCGFMLLFLRVPFSSIMASHSPRWYFQYLIALQRFFYYLGKKYFVIRYEILRFSLDSLFLISFFFWIKIIIKWPVSSQKYHTHSLVINYLLLLLFTVKRHPHYQMTHSSSPKCKTHHQNWPFNPKEYKHHYVEPHVTTMTKPSPRKNIYIIKIYIILSLNSIRFISILCHELNVLFITNSSAHSHPSTSHSPQHHTDHTI